MIIELNELELSVLTFHMQAMRKNVKRGFKSNYGNKDGKEILKNYDSAKQSLITALDNIGDSEKVYISFNVQELNMLTSFIDWYVPELEKTFKELTKEDKVQIDTLLVIHAKIQLELLDHVS